MTAAGAGAILLAGGRASRLGGLDKPLLEIDGRSLLQRAVDAVPDAAGAIVVVGPERPAGPAGVAWVREDPPFTGPAAAVVAAVRASAADQPGEPPWTFVLACDLVDPAAAAQRLREARNAAPDHVDGMCLVDDDGRPQWLTGVYRTDRLRAAAVALPHAGADASVRALVAPLRLTVVEVRPGAIMDIDTWDDLERARARVPASATSRPIRVGTTPHTAPNSTAKETP